MVNSSRKIGRCARKYCFSLCVYLLVLIVLLFLVTFAILPISFKYSVNFQRSIIFPAAKTHPQKNFTDFPQYKIQGGRNFYVTVNVNENITLGVWHLLPHQLANNTPENGTYEFDTLLRNSSYDVVLYLHGNSNFRTDNGGIYAVLRQFFHVIACDYRGFGDSTAAELREEAIVDDITRLYTWLLRQTTSDIFIWGHSLGTGVATQTAANLKRRRLPLTGLVLEAPFTNVIDVVRDSPLGRFFSWVPWFEHTIIRPLIENGMVFNSTRYIQQVECPVLILHAVDDYVISHKFADKLYATAVSHRKFSAGNVTYRLFAYFGYGHLFIYKAPSLPQFIEEFVEDCKDYDYQTALT